MMSIPERSLADLKHQLNALKQSIAALESTHVDESILAPLRAQAVHLEQQILAAGGTVTPEGTQAMVGDHVDMDVRVSGNGQVGDIVATKIVHSELEAASPEALRQAYLGRLLEMVSQLSLAGIDPKAASEVEARLSLGAVYTALLTLTPEAQEKRVHGEMPERAARRLSALEQLNQHPRLVLLGDPGSGKSTFVNFVALCLAGEALERGEANLRLLTAPLPPEEDEPQREKEEPQPQPWGHGALLPVRVVLRDFAARGLPASGERATARNLWDFIVADLESAALGAFERHLVNEMLKQGGLLLLDGLDEVPEAEQRRAQIKEAIEDFAAAFSKCRILVTSRTYAYQKQDWRLRGFVETVLAPFSAGQIRQFVGRWYEHIAILRNLHPEDAQGRAELLRRAIFSSDRLLGLAERPLLLTLMASLHAWRGGTLPEKREALYADTVDLLLDWWESPKVVRDARGQEIVSQPSLAEWLKVDRQKVRELLEALAFAAHSSQPDPSPGSGQALQGTADVPEGDLVGGLLHLSQNPELRANPALLVDYLSQRAGLLVPRGVGVYTFPHRTFQEYLAACYLTDHDYPEQVAGLACQDFNRWREVALLAGAKAARGTKSAIWSLVDALCYLDARPDCEAGWLWGAHLAAQALVESADLAAVSQRNQPKVERVRRWLVRILAGGELPAVERAQAGDSLARLGDPRFDPQAWQLPAEPQLGFVEIPAGSFSMGGEEERHELVLPVYYMARYPVTVAQFRVFVEDSGYEPRDRDSFQGIANHPVVLVTWHDALAYCRWLTGKLQHRAREQVNGGERGTAFWQGLAEGRLHVSLPSEAEWEKAARGADMREYPWGSEFDLERANTAETGLGTTSAVGCFPGGASPYGLLDMAGNVWEWTRSLWGKDWGSPDFKYPYDPADGRENLDAPDGILRVLRGGSWFFTFRYARCAYRYGGFPHDWYDNLGFRVVVVSLAGSES